MRIITLEQRNVCNRKCNCGQLAIPQHLGYTFLTFISVGLKRCMTMAVTFKQRLKFSGVGEIVLEIVEKLVKLQIFFY